MTSDAPNMTSSAPRRKSGRVSRKPEQFVPASSPAGRTKRKRAEETDGDADAAGMEEEEEEQESSSEGEPDEEELREKRRNKKTKAAPKKPAAKKPKTNGAPVSLAIRPATSKPKKPRKAPLRKSALVDEDAEGLYGELAAYAILSLSNFL
jgi:cohesin complex subunit SA-1/2